MPALPNLISFNEDGTCSQCREYEPVRLAGEGRLVELLESCRNGKNKYDCMVTISGCRDSSFTLLKMVKDYRLRVLAVNYENPFVDEQAATNIQNTTKALGVKLVQFRWHNRIHERIVADHLRAWLKRPSPAMVPAICVGCKIMWYHILKIARDHGIKCIVSGGNPYEYTSFKKVLLGVPHDADLVTTYMLNVFCLAKETLLNVSYLSPRNLPWMIKGYLFGNQYSVGTRLLGIGIEKIDLFHYISWDEDMVLSRIREELGWESPQSLPSTWRFDCRLSHLKDLMYLLSLGVTEKDDFYSKLIREKMITRKEALLRVEKENKLHQGIIDDLFHQLGINDVTFLSLSEKTGI